MGELKEQHSRTKVDSSRRKAWAFTRLRMLGYPQYLRIRRRSNLSTFIVCKAQEQRNNIKLNNYNMKKLLLLVLLFFPLVTKADKTGKCGDNLSFIYVEETLTLTISGTGDMYNYEGFSSVPWNDVKYRIQKIAVEQGVTSIGKYAFAYFSQLTSVSLANSIYSIGGHAFSGCRSLQSIDIPDNVVSIGEWAFSNCERLLRFDSPDDLYSIGDYAFYNCSNLTTVSFSNNTTSIGKHLFTGCNSLTELTVDNSNDTYDSRDNCNGIIETATNTLVYGCKGTQIPSTVTTIGYQAFEECQMVSVVIPKTIKSIDAYAFIDCTALTDVYCWATELPQVGYSVFERVDLSKATLHVPTNVVETYATTEPWSNFGAVESLVKEIDGLYYYVNRGTQTAEIIKNPNGQYTGEVVIPSSIVYKDIIYNVTSIGKNAFMSNASLSSISIPNTVTQIGSGAFNACTGLTEIEIPNSVTTIGKSICFRCTNLSSVSIGDGLTVVSDEAFRLCENLVSVTLGENIETIEAYAFSNCARLSNITLHEKLTSIGERAFAYTSLSEVYCYAKVLPAIASNAFLYTDISNSTLYVPYASLGVYASDGVWGRFGIIEPIKTKIGNLYYGLNEDDKIAVVVSSPETYTGEVVIPETLSYEGATFTITSVAANAFKGCSGITSVAILGIDTQISEGAFNGCNQITSLSLNTKNIGVWFTDSKGTIGELTIGNTVETIEDGAFYDFTALQAVVIPANVTTIGNSAFYGCKALKRVELHCQKVEPWFRGIGIDELIIGPEVTSIGNYAFENCSNIESVVVSENMESIGIQAFYGCSKVKKIVLGSNLSEIGFQAFANCRKLEDVYSYAIRYPIAAENTFENSYVEYVTLHVPEESMQQYSSVTPWMNFKEIVSLSEYDPKPTDIHQINHEIGKEMICYDLQGIRIKTPKKGLYVINGKKIFVK